MIHILALQNLISNPIFNWVGNDWEGLEWLDDRPQPTKEEWEIEKAKLIAQQPFQNCKTQAKQLLSKTDWSNLNDVQNELDNYEEFVEYRKTLRNYIINPVENPDFPIEPEARWKV